jgi:hypothetical protein
MQTSTLNRLTSALVVSLLVGGAVLALGSGSALADVTTDTANFSDVGNETLADQTLMVDNSTRSVYLEMDNSSGTANGTVNVTVYGIDESDVQTRVDRVQVSAGANSTELYEYESLDTQTYDEYRVVAEGNSSFVDPDTLTIGTVSEVAGGGGTFSLGGDVDLAGYSIPFGVVGAIVVAGAVVLLGRD